MGISFEKACWIVFAVILTVALAIKVWRTSGTIRPAELPLDSDLQQYNPEIARLIADRRARNAELEAAER